MDLHFDSRGGGEPLVLLHGFSGCGGNWDLIFKEPPEGYRLIAVDLPGHGRSPQPPAPFTHREAAPAVLALMDRLDIGRFQGIGLSAGGNVLLHMASRQPERVEAMVTVSATPYFPEQARAVMRTYTEESRTAEEWAQMRRWHPRGDEQIRWLWAQVRGFAESHADMSFTPPLLAGIQARTLIVHGDRDPLYPVRLAVEMREAIPRSWLWVVPDGGHGPVFGDLTTPFVQTAMAFLRASGAWAGS